jgi:thiol-disulfide isomerase/thioredoxin
MKRWRLYAPVTALCLVAVWAGCSRPSRDKSPPADVSATTPVSPNTRAPSPPETVTFDDVDPAHFDAVVKKYRGKVLLVDFWATWCTTCKGLFPHTVALSRELAASGLAVVSVSLDGQDEKSQAREFLAAQGARFENLRATTGASSESAMAFGIDGGAIPFLRLYDRAGRLRQTFPSPVKPAAVEEAVRRLVAEPANGD